MSTFTWHKLTVHVGEMNRATALRCAQDINALVRAMPRAADAAEQAHLDEQVDLDIDVLIAIHAPAVVKLDGQQANGSGVVFDVDGIPVSVKVPFTAETFNALPLSLATEWTIAALSANGWLREAAKNSVSLATVNVPEPKSGSGQ